MKRFAGGVEVDDSLLAAVRRLVRAQADLAQATRGLVLQVAPEALEPPPVAAADPTFGSHIIVAHRAVTGGHEESWDFDHANSMEEVWEKFIRWKARAAQDWPDMRFTLRYSGDGR